MLFWNKPKLNPQYLIVGLGNPGAEYSGTRHNVGFRAIDLLAKRLKINLKERKHRALYGCGKFGDTQICIAKPMTYMNLSGQAIKLLMSQYHLNAHSILVILDDMALSVGKVRVRSKGSSGGHNGLKSIEHYLGTQEYSRIRIGIGQANPGNAIDHVLGTFKRDEFEDVDESLQIAADAAVDWLIEDIETVMNRYNSKK